MGAFSESVMFWLKIQSELVAAEERFRDEFHRMLSRVEARFSQDGWRTSISEERLQVYRPQFQHNCQGAHYEAGSWGDFFRRAVVHLGLHVETEMSNHSAVRERLRWLLKRHENRLLSATSCKVVSECHWRVLEGVLQLVDASDEAIGDAMEKLTQTETFVSEAMFLADRKRVWRTDVLSDDPVPEIDWSVWSGKEGGRGGWQLRSEGGRLDAPSLICQGDKRNFKGTENIVAIHESEGKPFRGFAPGQHVYCCSAVRSPTGGSMTFTLQTTKEGRHQSAYSETRSLAADDRWQIVCFEGELMKLADYDPISQGLYAYVVIDPPRQPITVDSIEIGTACCPQS